MNSINDNFSTEIADMLAASFEQQRSSFLSDPTPDHKQRVQDLLALKQMINENREDIISAINQDYGNRSRQETLFAEIITVTDSINDTIKHLKKWMKVQHRHVDKSMFFGAKNRLIPQPLGVVGLIIPWNFPVNLTFTQLACVFAAGNRAMVKMSATAVALPTR